MGDSTEDTREITVEMDANLHERVKKCGAQNDASLSETAHRLVVAGINYWPDGGRIS